MDRKKKADGLLAGTVLICLLAAPFKETGLLGGGLFHMAFAAVSYTHLTLPTIA